MPTQKIRSPFVCHEGRWYIVLGWEKNIKAGADLHLRPLTEGETRLLESYRDNFDAECWAVIAARNQSKTASTKR